MRILLIGANGQLGNEVKLTVPKDVDLISFDRNHLDITSKTMVENSFNSHQPNLVINTAAYTAVDRAEEESELAYAVNVTGPLNLAKECKKLNIPLIHISTDYVFDGSNKKPYQETDATGPLSVYGKTKLEGEEAIRAYLPEHVILRTSWLFSNFGSNFVKTILRLAQQKTTLRIIADQYGCPTAAENVAATIWKMIAHLNRHSLKEFPWGLYHYTDQPAVNWFQFAERIVSIAKEFRSLSVKELIPITTAEYPTLAKRPAYSVLNNVKLNKIFAIEPTLWHPALEEVMRRIIQ